MGRPALSHTARRHRERGGASFLERRSGEAGHRQIRDRRHDDGRVDIRRTRGPHRGVRQRRDALGRAAALLPDRVHAGPGEGRSTEASRMEERSGVQGADRPRSRSARHDGTEADPEAPRRRQLGDDDCGVRQDDPRLARKCKAPEVSAAVHRSRLRADAGAARIPAREQLQDFHRLGRQHRVHAALGRKSVRHPARADHRHDHGNEIRHRRTASRR